MSFEPDARVQEVRERGVLPYPVLRDPRREAYRHFGIERRPARKIFGIATLWYYTRSLLRGRLPEMIKGDPYQLGGNVLLDVDGSTIWIYSSQEPADRPAVDDIFKEIDRHDQHAGV